MADSAEVLRAYQTGNGRDRDVVRATELLERSLALDPGMISAGEAVKALEQARQTGATSSERP